MSDEMVVGLLAVGFMGGLVIGFLCGAACMSHAKLNAARGWETACGEWRAAYYEMKERFRPTTPGQSR